MGSYIHLYLDRLEIDWGKNSSFADHSVLFESGDLGVGTYYYAADVTEEKAAYVRVLGNSVRRLEMLGYTLAACDSSYSFARESFEDHDLAHTLSFTQFLDALRSCAVTQVGVPPTQSFRISALLLTAVPALRREGPPPPEFSYQEQVEWSFFDSLDPLLLLRVLAENPANLELPISWTFDDVVSGGYVEPSSLRPGAQRASQCLVVTEGATDGLILQRSLEAVAPDVADFFDFVDMTENYPFTGTGSLFRFCQGLARIGVGNRMLIVLDNDTAGREAYEKIQGVGLPSNVHLALLPDLHACREMTTLGPSGAQVEDVNGRAVSIECFLDFEQSGLPDPAVRWTAFNQGMDEYQGELVDKKAYFDQFMLASKRRSEYDYSKLRQLWDYLIRICTGTAAPKPRHDT